MRGNLEHSPSGWNQPDGLCLWSKRLEQRVSDQMEPLAVPFDRSRASAVLGWRAMTIGVLFVCTGNICRSPMAKGVFTTLVRRAGLADAFIIDSAGTYEGHAGKPASPLAIAAARRRGYDIADHKARLLTNADLERF